MKDAKQSRQKPVWLSPIDALGRNIENALNWLEATTKTSCSPQQNDLTASSAASLVANLMVPHDAAVHAFTYTQWFSVAMGLMEAEKESHVMLARLLKILVRFGKTSKQRSAAMQLFLENSSFLEAWKIYCNKVLTESASCSCDRCSSKTRQMTAKSLPSSSSSSLASLSPSAIPKSRVETDLLEHALLLAKTDDSFSNVISLIYLHQSLPSAMTYVQKCKRVSFISMSNMVHALATLGISKDQSIQLDKRVIKRRRAAEEEDEQEEPDSDLELIKPLIHPIDHRTSYTKASRMVEFESFWECWTRAALARNASIMADYDGQAVANTFWAYGTLGITPHDDVLCKLLDRYEQNMHFVNAQEVANAIWALSRIDRLVVFRYSFQNECSFWKSWIQSFLRTVAYMDEQELSMSIWAIADLGIDEVFRQIYRQLEVDDPEDLTFSTTNRPHIKYVITSDSPEDELELLYPKTLAHIGGSPLLTAPKSPSKSRGNRARTKQRFSRELGMTAKWWVECGREQFLDAWKGSFEHLVDKQHSTQLPSTNRMPSKKPTWTSSQSLSNSLWALVRLGESIDDSFWNTWNLAFESCWHVFRADELRDTIRSWSVIGRIPSRASLYYWRRTFRRRLQDMDIKRLVSITISWVRLCRLDPSLSIPPELIQVVTERYVHEGNMLHLDEHSMFLWACSKRLFMVPVECRRAILRFVHAVCCHARDDEHSRGGKDGSGGGIQRTDLLLLDDEGEERVERGKGERVVMVPLLDFSSCYASALNGQSRLKHSVYAFQLLWMASHLWPEFSNSSTMDSWCRLVTPVLPSSSTSLLVHSMRLLGRQNFVPNAEFFDAWQERFVNELKHNQSRIDSAHSKIALILSPQAALRVWWACGKLGQLPCPEIQAHFGACFMEYMQYYNDPRSLLSILQAYRRLGLVPQDELIQVWQMAAVKQWSEFRPGLKEMSLDWLIAWNVSPRSELQEAWIHAGWSNDLTVSDQ